MVQFGKFSCEKFFDVVEEDRELDKKHCDDYNIEGICKVWGYSRGEIKVMIDYWEMKENEQQEKIKKCEQIMKALKLLVEI